MGDIEPVATHAQNFAAMQTAGLAGDLLPCDLLERAIKVHLHSTAVKVQMIQLLTFTPASRAF